VTRGRHSLAPRAPKPRRFALVAAPLITCGLVGVGVATTDLGASFAGDKVDFSAYGFGDAAAGARSDGVSRSANRATLFAAVKAKQPVPEIKKRLWTTTELDLRLSPAEDAKVAGEYDSLRKIGVTGVHRNGYAQVVVAREVRWVTEDYLAAEKPTDPAHLPMIDRPCAGTSGVESGITAGAIRVYRAVCNNFPQIDHYGGYDAHGEHSSGRALDIMTSDVALGTAIADFLRAHAAELNLYDIIWRQHIFTQQRGGEGWRSMPDRGSATANHFDHVHVSVY
jgi:hypothetical protein